MITLMAAITRQTNRRLEVLYSAMVRRAHRHGKLIRFHFYEYRDKAHKALIVGLCPYCFKELDTSNISGDHVDPISWGGSWDLDNVEFCCLPCNIKKSDKPLRHFLNPPKPMDMSEAKRLIAIRGW